MTQLPITKCYTRNDVEPIIEIKVGYIATQEDDGWWLITDKEGQKVCRVSDASAKELTVVEEEYQIKSNELRYGSIVLMHGEKDTVCEIGQSYNGFCQKQGYFNLDKGYMNPIAITDEILSKFSLKLTTNQETTIAKFENNTLNLPKDNELSYDPESKQFMLNGMFLPESPKYVHQLQNLIFALTFIEPVITDL